MTSAVIVDVEGDGQRPPNLVEVSVGLFDKGSLTKVDTWLLKPPGPITYFANRVHGITLADVEGCPSVEEKREEMVQAMSVGDVFVAHGLHVEREILGRVLGFEPAAALDTLTVSRRLVPGMPSYSLGPLTQAMSLVPPSAKLHRAEADVRATTSLLRYLLEREPTLLDAAWQARAVPTQDVMF